MVYKQWMRFSGGNTLLRGLVQRWLPNLTTPPIWTAPRGDLTGAIAGTLSGVPQTMAYGLIIGLALGDAWSGVGVVAALVSAVMAGLIVALLGGCSVVVAGPRAATILVLAGLYSQLQNLPGLREFGATAPIALALGAVAVVVAGLVQMSFGLLRLGRLASYIPFPVVAGFVNGSAILILMSQIWPATGVPVQHSLADFFRHLDEIRPATLLLSLGTALLILNGGRLVKRVPAPFVGVAAGAVVYHVAAAFGLDGGLGGTMAALPDHVDFQFIGPDAWRLLGGPLGAQVAPLVLTAALTIAVLSSLDTLLTALACDAALLRRSNGSRQLVAEGLSNVLAGAFALPPSAGSMARISGALRSGMTTALGPILIAALTVAVLLGLAPFLAYLPKAVMAGLLIAVAVSLFDKWSVAMLRKLLRAPDKHMVAHGDLLAVAVVMVTTVVVNLATAVAVGILVSLVSFVVQMGRSPIRRVYRATALMPRILGNEQRRRFIERHGDRIAVIEMEGALFYGSAAPLEGAVDRLIAQGVVTVVIDLKRVQDIDATGARVLERIQTKLFRLGGVLAIGYLERERRDRNSPIADGEERRKDPPQGRLIWRKLDFLGALAALGEEHLLPDTEQAVALCERHLARRAGAEDDVPEMGWAQAAILRGFDRDTVRRLRSVMTMCDYRAGETVFAQGDPPDSVYFIASGAVEVVLALSGTERRLRLQTLTKGEVFGEMAIIAPSPRSAAVVAVEPTRCYRLEAAAFERLKGDHPHLAFSLLSNLAGIFVQRLRATNIMLAELEV